MGFIDGKIVYHMPTEGAIQSAEQVAVLQVNASSDNAPAAWDNHATTKSKMVSVPYHYCPDIKFAATKLADLSADNQVTNGTYWSVGSAINSKACLENLEVGTGITYVGEKFGVRLGVNVDAKGRLRFNVLLAKAEAEAAPVEEPVEAEETD